MASSERILDPCLNGSLTENGFKRISANSNLNLKHKAQKPFRGNEMMSFFGQVSRSASKQYEIIDSFENVYNVKILKNGFMLIFLTYTIVNVSGIPFITSTHIRTNCINTPS